MESVDYDVIYFDPDLSWEAEDRAIERLKQHLPRNRHARVEVRNQARVHLWFESRFGRSYPPLTSADDALNRAVATVHAVSVRLGADGTLQLTAPLGFHDIDAMVFRAGPGGAAPDVVEQKAREALARWPQAALDSRPWQGAAEAISVPGRRG